MLTGNAGPEQRSATRPIHYSFLPVNPSLVDNLAALIHSRLAEAGTNL